MKVISKVIQGIWLESRLEPAVATEQQRWLTAGDTESDRKARGCVSGKCSRQTQCPSCRAYKAVPERRLGKWARMSQGRCTRPTAKKGVTSDREKTTNDNRSG